MNIELKKTLSVFHFGTVKKLLQPTRVSVLYAAFPRFLRQFDWFTAISRKAVGKTFPKGIVGILTLRFLDFRISGKFEKMTRNAMDVCFRVLKEDKRKFDTYCVKNRYLSELSRELLTDSLSQNSYIQQ